MTQPSSRPPFPPPHPQVLPGYAAPPRRSAAPLVAGLCGLVAAGLALGGSFAPVYEISGDGSRYQVTWWSVDRAGDIGIQNSLSGATLVLATLLLGIGAVLAIGRRATPARLLLTLGLGSLTGTALLMTTFTLQDLEAWRQIPLDAGQTLQFTTSAGLWVPLGGVLFAVAAVVFAYRGGGPVRVEPLTPKMGFPMPYGPEPATGTQPVVVAPMNQVGTATAGGTPSPFAPPPAAPTAPGAAAAAAAAAAAVTPPSGFPRPVVEPVAEPLAEPAATPVEPSTSDAEATQRATVEPEPFVADPFAADPSAPEPPAPEAITHALTPEDEIPGEVPPPVAPPAPEAPAVELPAVEDTTAPEPDSTPDTAPEPPATQPEPEPEHAAEAGEEPRGLGDLPAAPPAPELADEQEPRRD